MYITNYADYNKIYKVYGNIGHKIRSLEDAASMLYKWFSDNQMEGSTNKCDLLMTKNKSFDATTVIFKTFNAFRRTSFLYYLVKFIILPGQIYQCCKRPK